MEELGPGWMASVELMKTLTLLVLSRLTSLEEAQLTRLNLEMALPFNRTLMPARFRGSPNENLQRTLTNTKRRKKEAGPHRVGQAKELGLWAVIHSVKMSTMSNKPF